LVTQPQKEEAGEPSFIDVDNPGLWDEYTFKPKFAQKATKDYRKGQFYVYHSLPSTGARPVPADETGSRNRAGWEFHYGVWTNPAGNTFQSGATWGNHFPESRKEYLDFALLKRMCLLLVAASFPSL
jgi:hypothetical protein